MAQSAFQSLSEFYRKKEDDNRDEANSITGFRGHIRRKTNLYTETLARKVPTVYE